MKHSNICGRCKNKLTKKWSLVMTGVKTIAMIFLFLIIYLSLTEIKTVNFLSSDQCVYCMEQIGAVCHVNPIDINFSNVSFNEEFPPENIGKYNLSIEERDRDFFK